MKYFTRYFSYNCCAAAYQYKHTHYIFSPFAASLLTGAIYSFVIKEWVSKELLYVKRQNEEIIARLKKLQNDENVKI
jgi:hypothetical protein